MVKNIKAMFWAVEKIKLSRIFSDVLVRHIPSHDMVNICNGEKPIYANYCTISLQPQSQK